MVENNENAEKLVISDAHPEEVILE